MVGINADADVNGYSCCRASRLEIATARFLPGEGNAIRLKKKRKEESVPDCACVSGADDQSESLSKNANVWITCELKATQGALE
jgi:hypothetical protein